MFEFGTSRNYILSSWANRISNDARFTKKGLVGNHAYSLLGVNVLNTY